MLHLKDGNYIKRNNESHAHSNWPPLPPFLSFLPSKLANQQQVFCSLFFQTCSFYDRGMYQEFCRRLNNTNTCQVTLTIPLPNTNTTQKPNTNTLPNTNTFFSVKRKCLSIPLPLHVDLGNIFTIKDLLPLCFYLTKSTYFK